MEERRNSRKWTQEEDERLLRQIESFPQNLSKCFMIVAEETGRSKQGVASHWYTVLSKRDDVMAFFTASHHHVSKNRKNGAGVESTETIWRRLVRIISGLFNS